MTADVVVELLATMWQPFSDEGADTPDSTAPILTMTKANWRIFYVLFAYTTHLFFHYNESCKLRSPFTFRNISHIKLIFYD